MYECVPRPFALQRLNIVCAHTPPLPLLLRRRRSFRCLCTLLQGGARAVIVRLVAHRGGLCGREGMYIRGCEDRRGWRVVLVRIGVWMGVISKVRRSMGA